MQKVIFITGASSGIGKETALYFASKGWLVAATMRNTILNSALFSNINQIRLYKLDVNDESQIEKAIENAIADYGHIDVLLNNAGYALSGAFEAMTKQQIQNQFATNVFGVMNVTKAILPHFRNRKTGMIITITSMGGLITFPLWSAYHSTKWAIEGFMESLHFELQPFHIKVKVIEPGAIQTEFTKSIQLAVLKPYENYIAKVERNMMATYRNAPTAIVVAKKVFEAATDSSSKLRYTLSFQSKILLFLRNFLPYSLFFYLVKMVTEKGVKSKI